MHKAAVQLTQSGRTELPKTSKELQSLPGFGAYTAGAVASIAYGLPEPAVDGNVVRVLTRQFGLQGVCDGAPARRTLAAVIPSLMPNGRASEFNQALFDVGATLCKPKSPLCDACPVSMTCVALKTSSIDQFPAPRKQPSLTAHVVAVARITDGDQVMLRQRSVSETRMPEFWEMPECWAPDETSARAGLIAAVKELGYEVSLAETAAVRVRHSITTHRLDCRLFEASHSARKDPPEWPASTKWMTRAELNGGELPVTTVTRKLISKWLRLSKETVR
jgi:A/G-specific adenine glycosylase